MSAEASHTPDAGEPLPDSKFFSRAEVLQSSNVDLYDKLGIFALHFAVLGYVDTAFNLIGRLNKHNWYHDRYHYFIPLYIVWDQIGRWPDGELDRVRESIKIQRTQAAEKRLQNDEGEETGKRMKLEVDGSPITDEAVSKFVADLYHKWAQCWWYPGRPYPWVCEGEREPRSPHDRNVESTADDLRRKMQELINAVREAEDPQKPKDPRLGKSPVDISAALVSALDLRIKLREKGGGDDDDVPSEKEILEMIARRLSARDASYQIEKLVQSRRAWLMLRNGDLLKVMGIDKTKVDVLATQFEQAVTERLEKGRQPPPDISMERLVQRINTNTLTNPESIDMFREQGLEVPSTILHDSAPAPHIEEAEARLEIKLPADYKEYLSITNGNDAAWGGIINEPPLWRCEDIRWFTDDEDYFSDLTVDIPAVMSSILQAIFEDDDEDEWPVLGPGIIIAQEDVDNVFLVAPATVAEVRDKVREILESEDANVTRAVKDSVRSSVDGFAGSMEEFEELEWCCVAWSGGGASGMDVHKSFKEYLTHVAERGGEKGKSFWNLDHREFFGCMFMG